jgi:hypothetical protein
VKEIGLLILSVVITSFGVFIFLKPRDYKEDVAATSDHPIGDSPTWAIRMLGVLFVVGGLLLFYRFLTT